MPITKHSFLVKKAEDIAPTIRRAFEIAASGRPGPVLIDITKDATANTAEYTKQIPKKIDNYKIQSEVEDFDKVIEMINAAERPFIYAGGGVIAAGGVGAAYQVQRAGRRADNDLADGHRRVPRERSQFHWDDRHARNKDHLARDKELRPFDCDRRKILRESDLRAGFVRKEREDHTYRRGRRGDR